MNSQPLFWRVKQEKWWMDRFLVYVRWFFAKNSLGCCTSRYNPEKKTFLSHKCTRNHKASVTWSNFSFLPFRSDSFLISNPPTTTKTYYRGEERGLSKKHIIESVQASLKRLQLDYIDIVIIHKADSMCPMEGNPRASLEASCAHSKLFPLNCRGCAGDELRH